MTKFRMLAFVLGGVAAGYSVARLGRSRVERQLASGGFDAGEAADVASQMTTKEALAAGLRVLTGQGAIAPSASVTITPN
jgi:hypothetical protein